MNKLFPCNNREGPEGSICNNCGLNHTITEEALKKIGIEDIKQEMKGYHKWDENDPGCVPCSCGECRMISAKIEYIKERFDIKEADLK